MAIRVIERGESRGWTTDETGLKTFTRQWLVEADAAIDEPTANDAVNLFDPTSILYASHPSWPWALCRKVTGRSASKLALQWVVDASYSTGPFRAMGAGGGTGLGFDGTAGNTTAPTAQQANSTPANQRPPTLSVKRRDVVKALEKNAVTGLPVVNSVGDKFDPAPEVFRSHHIFTYEFFRSPSELNWASRSTYQDSINLAAVVILGQTYPQYALRCVDYSLDSVWETGAAGLEFFWKLTCVIEHDPDTWKVKILNTGRRKIVSGKAVQIVDGNGQPVSDPVPLDGGGNPIDPGGTYSYIDQDGYVPLSWSNILA